MWWKAGADYLRGMKNLPVSRIMTTPLVTVAPDDTLTFAMKLLEQRKVHHLLVVERDRMVGILSSADLLKLTLLLQPESEQGIAESAEAMGIKVREVMQTRVAVVREHSSLMDAAGALSLGGFHALPVLSIDDTPVGIVTSSDLVGLLIDRIDRDEAVVASTDFPPEDSRNDVNPRLVEVLRAAEIYLRSGHSDQQHARLTRAVERARETMPARAAN
jgi:CBS domain-containing protein